MKFAEAKMLFESGAIFEPRIFIPPSGSGWCLEFKSKRDVTFPLYLETERGSSRIYKNINSAINACVNIGCLKVFLDLSK